MNILRVACITSVTSFALVLGACTDDPGTDSEAGTTETGDEDSENTMSGCGEETETVLEDIFVTPSGFDTPINELLAPLEGSFEGSFTWYEDGGPWSATHAGSESMLTAALAYSAGSVRLVEVEKHGQLPDGEGGGIPCSNYVVVDVVLEFTTADGVFAESLMVPISIPAIDGGPTSFSTSLDLDATMGTLGVDDFTSGDGMLTDAVLRGSVTESELYGNFSIEVSSGTGSNGSVSFESVAQYSAPRLSP